MRPETNLLHITLHSLVYGETVSWVPASSGRLHLYNQRKASPPRPLKRKFEWLTALQRCCAVCSHVAQCLTSKSKSRKRDECLSAYFAAVDGEVGRFGGVAAPFWWHSAAKRTEGFAAKGIPDACPGPRVVTAICKYMCM
jgi:hypothetical protein